MSMEDGRMLVYTNGVGGKFKAGWNADEFEKVRDSGEIQVRRDEDDGPFYEPANFVAVVKIEDDFDHALGRSRYEGR